MRFRIAASIAAALLPIGCSGAATVPASAPPAAPYTAAVYSAANDIPPRLQWGANFGYCGETSMIAAGLYFGQYTSQYTARAIASDDTPQHLYRSQLLLGVNDMRAARLMHLNYTEWNRGGAPNTDDFLSWVTANVVLGRPVIIGIFTNEYLFYDNKHPRAGSPTYDHIVPVTGVTSLHPLGARSYYATDTLTFSDNGLWAPLGVPRYTFTYPFGSFEQTRAQANERNGTIYSIKNAPPNYGIAILGVSDPGHETVPVRVATSVNYERPVMKNGEDKPPKPMVLNLTVTVSGLKPGAAYNLYRYDDFSNVPDRDFNAAASKASQHWSVRIARGSTYALTQTILSSWTVVYRAVPASAP